MELRTSIIEHSIALLIFSALAIHIFVRRRVLRRTTRHPPVVYWLMIGVAVFLAAINLYQLLDESMSEEMIVTVPWMEVVTHIITILALSSVTLLLIANKIVITRTPQPRRILIIGAHPDDMEIAAGAAMAKFHDVGYRISGLVCTCGEGGGDAQVRSDEAKHGADFMGLDEVRVLHLPDTYLKDHSVELAKAIEDMVKQVQPNLIFTHSANDIHQDHQAVHEATLRAGRNHTSILCYESPSATPDFKPLLFVDVGDYVDVKVEAVRQHRDQQDKPYMLSEVVRGKLAFRGSQAKVLYAEGFETVRLLYTC
jgi:LmbE family N-acetylglucosaminyl deacetylase